jgi:hypothetical protein
MTELPTIQRTFVVPTTNADPAPISALRRPYICIGWTFRSPDEITTVPPLSFAPGGWLTLYEWASLKERAYNVPLTSGDNFEATKTGGTGMGEPAFRMLPFVVDLGASTVQTSNGNATPARYMLEFSLVEPTPANLAACGLTLPGK